MNRRGELAYVPTLLLAAACLSVHSFSVWAGLFLGILCLGALWKKPVPVDLIGQVILILVTAAISYIWHFSLNEPPKHVPPRQLGAIVQTASFFFVGIGVGRLYVAKPFWSGSGTPGFLFIGWLVLGGGQLGLAYLVLAVAGVLALVVGYRFAQPNRADVKKMTPSRRLLAGASWLAAAMVAGSILVVMPILYERAMERYYSGAWARRTGFTDVIRLGSLRDLIQSDEVVMRLFNAPGGVGYLRGKVFSNYGQGRWAIAPNRDKVEFDSELPTDLSRVVEMRIVGGDDDRYFFPLNAGMVHTEESTVLVDGMGVVTTGGRKRTSRAWFETSGERGWKGWQLDPPQVGDRLVSPAVAKLVGSLGERWTRGATTDKEKMRRLVTKLQADYSYSLEFERRTKKDPVVEFLVSQKQGHCEYFASALALLGRQVGVPTRVVGGYNVTEFNEFGDYFVVRQRNAHTWVEAWIEGKGWTTYDATPPGPVEYAPSAVSAALDLVPAFWGSFMTLLSGMSELQLFLAVAGLLAFWVAVRLVRRFRRERVEKRVRIEYREPDASFVAMLKVLSRAGVPRDENEPLEVYAERLHVLGERGDAAAELVLSYSAWRYGEQGEIGSLGDRMSEWMERWG